MTNTLRSDIPGDEAVRGVIPGEVLLSALDADTTAKLGAYFGPAFAGTFGLTLVGERTRPDEPQPIEQIQS